MFTMFRTHPTFQDIIVNIDTVSESGSNSCLASALHHNPNLVYTLLYQKDMFTMFRTHPTFQDIIVNIDTVSE